MKSSKRKMLPADMQLRSPLFKKKLLYHFDTKVDDAELILGSKASILSDLYRQKLPIPPGFTISMKTTSYIYGEEGSKDIHRYIYKVKKAIAMLEKSTGKTFGGITEVESPVQSEFKGEANETSPLTLSIRTSSLEGFHSFGAIRDIGMNESIANHISHTSSNPKWGYEAYCRLLQSYGTIIFGIEEAKYRNIVHCVMNNSGVTHESQIAIIDLVQIANEFKRIAAIPEDPFEQLFSALHGMYKAWNNPQSKKFREMNGLNINADVAIIVQAMVYGNTCTKSGSGVVYSRDPNNGANVVVAEYLPISNGAQELAATNEIKNIAMLKSEHPGLFYNLMHVVKLMEKQFRNAQEIRFIVEHSALFILSVSTAKCSIRAAVKIAVSLVKEKLITEREALMRINPAQMISYFRGSLPAQFSKFKVLFSYQF